MLIPLKRTLSVIDAVVLLGLFGGYLWRTSQQEQEEPEHQQELDQAGQRARGEGRHSFDRTADPGWLRGAEACATVAPCGEGSTT